MIQPIKILTIFKEAWCLSRVQRLSLFYACVVFIMVAYFLPDLLRMNLQLGKLSPFLPANTPVVPYWWQKCLAPLSILFIQLPILAGLCSLVYQRVKQQKLELKQLYAHFKFKYLVKFVNLFFWCAVIFGSLLLVAILIYAFLHPYPSLQKLAYTILALWVVYLLIAYIMTIPLMVLRDLPVGKALTLSRITIHKYWFKVALLLLIAHIPILLAIYLFKFNFMLLYFYHPTQTALNYLPVAGLILSIIADYYLIPWYCLVFGKLYVVLFETNSHPSL